MLNLILVMAGGAVGSAGRYMLGRLVLTLYGPGFPWATLLANILGGLVMGLLAGVLARFINGGEQIRLLIGVGVLGGFTTFSSFSLETVLMLERGEVATGLAYVAASVIGAIAALWAGLLIVRSIA